MQKRASKMLFAGMVITMGMTVAAFAQVVPAVNVQPSHSLEVALAYNATYSRGVTGSNFWMQGGEVQVHGRFRGPIGVVADLAGAHVGNIKPSSSGPPNAGLDLVTATFGPRFTLGSLRSRYQFYGQALIGEANGFNSVFPSVSGATTSQSSMALKVGGGLNIWLAPHLAVRVGEASWLRTQLPNSTNNVQNSVTFGSGVVFGF